MPKKTVRFIEPDGTVCVHVFQKENGQEVEVECSQAEYNALGVAGAQPPTLPPQAQVWLYSVVRTKFNTSDGKPIKDDCHLRADGDAAVYEGGDIYHGNNFVVLPKDEYNPKKEGSDVLVTDKEIPSSKVIL